MNSLLRFTIVERRDANCLVMNCQGQLLGSIEWYPRQQEFVYCGAAAGVVLSAQVVYEIWMQIDALNVRFGEEPGDRGTGCRCVDTYEVVTAHDHFKLAKPENSHGHA